MRRKVWRLAPSGASGSRSTRLGGCGWGFDRVQVAGYLLLVEQQPPSSRRGFSTGPNEPAGFISLRSGRGGAVCARLG
jgi:hypothetical protein